MKIFLGDWWSVLPTVAADHPYITAVGLVLVIIALVAAIAFRPWELIKTWIQARPDAELTAIRDQAFAEKQAALELLRDVTARAEILRLTLDVARDTVERNNRLRGDSTPEDRETAELHLCDWITRLFGFSRSDINKITVWEPSSEGSLTVRTYNGMNPESADLLNLPINPTDPTRDTFAAMAFRSSETQTCSDIDSDARYHPLDEKPTRPYKSLIAIPIKVGHDVVGILTIDSLFVGTFDGQDAIQLAQLGASLCALWFASASAPEEPETAAAEAPHQPGWIAEHGSDDHGK